MRVHLQSLVCPRCWRTDKTRPLNHFYKLKNTFQGNMYGMLLTTLCLTFVSHPPQSKPIYLVYSCILNFSGQRQDNQGMWTSNNYPCQRDVRGIRTGRQASKGISWFQCQQRQIYSNTINSIKKKTKRLLKLFY